jgi:hypothetical protein
LGNRTGGPEPFRTRRAPMERDGTGWNWMARPISNQVKEGAWSPATESPSAFSTEGVPPVRQHPQGNPRGPHDAAVPLPPFMDVHITGERPARSDVAQAPRPT